MRIVAAFKRDCESKDDLKLGLLEFEALSGVSARRVSGANAWKLLGAKAPIPALAGRSLYAATITSDRLNALLRRLAFWELIAVVESNSERHKRGISPVLMPVLRVGKAALFVTQSQLLEWTSYAKESIEINGLLSASGSFEQLEGMGSRLVAEAMKSPMSPISRRKNDYLTHGFHKYKAKFFPRLARSLINCAMPGSTGVVLDPYCGSGTTGVEAALIGVNALQFDLDPLSVLIADTKSRLADYKKGLIDSVVAASSQPDTGTQLNLLSKRRYRLPKFLLERRPKRLTETEVLNIETEVSAIQELIDTTRSLAEKELLEVALSHAVSTKVSLRWMGTGDNRYALEVASRSTQRIFLSQLRYMQLKLRTALILRDRGFVGNLGVVQSAVSDCTRLPIADNSVDAVVTSPPYLPAASGRETYLRSRAASLMALELLKENAILELETEIVGSVLARPTSAPRLPASVIDLVEWMRPQRERTAKANPTLAYFEKLALSLKEMKRVLKPNGTIALVVSKEHTFWELTTRKVLRKFDMVKAISELASEPQYGIGLEVERVVVIELPKMDFAARPGAKGAYFEAVIFFRVRKAHIGPQTRNATELASKRSTRTRARLVTGARSHRK